MVADHRFVVRLAVAGLALLVLLAGCGAPASCPAGAAHHAVMFGVPTLEEVGNYWGLTEFGCSGKPSVVKISDEAPAELVGRVVAHEMLHVAGLVEHEASPSCYLHETIYPSQSITPCAEEIDRLLDTEGTYEIRVLDAHLVEHARGAASLWNDRAGREAFLVVDASGPVEE